MSSAYPTSPFEHRDAVLGISFPLAAIDFFPEVCGKPSPALQKLRPILKRLHDSLKVDRLSAGESRAIKAACDGAADNGAIYDTTATKEEQMRDWRVIWFTAETPSATPMCSPIRGETSMPHSGRRQKPLSTVSPGRCISTTPRTRKRRAGYGAVTPARTAIRNWRAYGRIE